MKTPQVDALPGTAPLGVHSVSKTLKEYLIGQDWVYDVFLFGGWSHHDVRDDDGDRIVFDNENDVAKYLGLTAE